MDAVIQVISKSFVKRFYTENAGFFLLGIGICFGFLKAPQHYDLGRFLAHEPQFYGITFLLWLLYANQLVRFNRKLFKQKESSIFYLLELVGKKRLWLISLRVQLGMFLPILSYAIFLMIVAVEEAQWLSVLLLILQLLFILSGLSYWQYKQYQKPQESIISRGGSKFAWKSNSLTAIYLKELFNTQSLKLGFQKLISLVIVYGFIQIYFGTDSDQRFVFLGILLGAMSNSFVSFKLVFYGQTRLQLFKNLPLSRSARIGVLVFGFFILCLPELLIILGQLIFELDVMLIFGAGLMMPILMLLFSGFAFMAKLEQERFTKWVFFSTSILFFVILAYTPLVLLLSLLFALGYLLVYREIDTFENV